MDFLLRHWPYKLTSALLTAVVMILAISIFADTPTTYFVAMGGNDANSGSQTAPFKTIQHAADLAHTGDTVVVFPGTFQEEVILKRSGVTYQSNGPTRSIIAGDGKRAHGFYVPDRTDLTDITIDGFEVTGQTVNGIDLYAYLPGNPSNFKIINNVVHHTPQQGIKVRGSNHLVQNNTVYSVAPDGEAMCFMLQAAKNTRVIGNTAYLCRKEGFRDIQGSGDTYENNISYLNWTGMSFNLTSSATGINNYIYDNVQGFNPKHNSGTPWSKFWHNTIYNSGWNGIAIAINPPILDNVDIRDNIIVGGGTGAVQDYPQWRTKNLILDGNLYARDAKNLPGYLYYDPDANRNYTTLAAVQQNTGFETNGKFANPGLLDPVKGNLDYPATSPAAAGGVQLDDSRGKQLGARGLTQQTRTWQPIPMRAVAASVNLNQAQLTTDNNWNTWWSSGIWGQLGTNTNQWITYDLGSSQTFRYINMMVTGEKAQTDVHNFNFQVSNDNTTFTTVYTGTNDNRGSSYTYELPVPATGRYLKFNMFDNQPDAAGQAPGTILRFSDLSVGNLVGQEAPALPARAKTYPLPPVQNDQVRNAPASGQVGAAQTGQTPANSPALTPTPVVTGSPKDPADKSLVEKITESFESLPKSGQYALLTIFTILLFSASYYGLHYWRRRRTS